MASDTDWFKKKRTWSKYKDLILDYYLTPYLAKVARLGKPITVVDCFAGAGTFEDGEEGSPLIVLRHLRKAADRGVQVKGLFIERNKTNYTRLESHVAASNSLGEAVHGDFREHLGRIEEAARNGSVLLYVDPFRPSQLLFHDLQSVYVALRNGSSVETLINFMSTGFVRAAMGHIGQTMATSEVAEEDLEAEQLNQIAGGSYWLDIAMNQTLSQAERIDAIAATYAKQMRRWFRWMLHYPIRENYDDVQPKYHLVFGSRSHHAVDLMNRAMVTARRKFVGVRFVEGRLFEDRPAEEIPSESEMVELVVSIVRENGPGLWGVLRAHATIRMPCFYTDTELNRAMRAAVKAGTLTLTRQPGVDEDKSTLSMTRS